MLQQITCFGSGTPIILVSVTSSHCSCEVSPVLLAYSVLSTVLLFWPITAAFVHGLGRFFVIVAFQAQLVPHSGTVGLSINSSPVLASHTATIADIPLWWYVLCVAYCGNLRPTLRTYSGIPVTQFFFSLTAAKIRNHTQTTRKINDDCPPRNSS
jgi:hypothetical protein